MTLIITIKLYMYCEWLKHGRLGIILLNSKYKKIKVSNSYFPHSKYFKIYFSSLQSFRYWGPLVGTILGLH